MNLIWGADPSGPPPHPLPVRGWALLAALHHLRTDRSTTMTTTRSANRNRGLFIDPVPDQTWRARAACAAPDVDPELFHPIARGNPAARQVGAAKTVCRRCPVVDPCRTWALAVLEDGIAGGLTEDERRQVRAGRAS